VKKKKPRSTKRGGNIVVLTAFILIALMAMLAFAVATLCQLDPTTSTSSTDQCHCQSEDSNQPTR